MGWGWWVISNFSKFPLSDHGVHLKILQTPPYTIHLPTCTMFILMIISFVFAGPQRTTICHSKFCKISRYWKNEITKFCDNFVARITDFAVKNLNLAVISWRKLRNSLWKELIMQRKESNVYNYTWLTKWQNLSPAIWSSRWCRSHIVFTMAYDVIKSLVWCDLMPHIIIL